MYAYVLCQHCTIPKISLCYYLCCTVSSLYIVHLMPRRIGFHLQSENISGVPVLYWREGILFFLQGTREAIRRSLLSGKTLP